MNMTTSPVKAVGHLPDFVIIGAMKAGTTSLYEYLSRHTEVCFATNKEPMYFSRDEVYGRGEEWYRNLFSSAHPAQLRGEASTCYSRAPHFPNVPLRMAQLIPQAKLIYLLRHPVERAYSHYRWDMQHLHLHGKYDAVTFEQALASTTEYVDTSSYIRQIQLFLKHFDRKQLLVITLDELKHDATGTLDRCQRFLGLSVRNLVAEGTVVANPSNGRRVSSFRLRKKVARLRRTPGLREVVNLLPIQFRRRARKRLLTALEDTAFAKHIQKRHASAVSPLVADTRQRLLEQFAEPTRELEQFLDRPLPEAWFR